MVSGEAVVGALVSESLLFSVVEWEKWARLVC